MHTSENKKGPAERRFLSGVRRKRKIPQIELSDEPKKKKYDIWAALAKALLVFMISFGAVGGFLNAYGLDYNWPLCLICLAVLAITLSLIYETEKKWFTNLCMIGIFIAYASVAVKQFWILNSGAYAVINEIYEAAQSYLGVTGGGLYNLQVNDSYRTITAIALFVGVVLEILLVIRLQYKASLIRTVILTFSLYLVPIYFEMTPDLFWMFLLFSGYATMGIMQCSKIKKHVSRQIKQALPAGIAVAAVVTIVIGVLLPQMRYRTMVPKNPSKEATEDAAVTFAQYGVMALFMNSSAGGGLNEGQLSQNVMLMPTDKTDLIVRFTPYSMSPTYLKAFTGLDYNGNSWSKATDVLGIAEGQMRETSKGRVALYEADPQTQPRGIMEVFNVDAKDYEYRPYYTDVDEIRPVTEGTPEGGKNGKRYVYYPQVTDAYVPGSEKEQVSERYLTVPMICQGAVSDACKKAGLSGTPEEIARELTTFFAENYSYTLRPGYYFGGLDYVSYFLSRNKKGYCTHFASAGTLMLRYMGIPARYVEGYVFSYGDVVTDGKIVEGANYEDYYDGYSPLGETGLIEMEIPDGQAHAWVEAYVEGKGWIVVDVTPAASEEEEEFGSFWEAILGTGGQASQNEQAQQTVAKYLENALAGGMGVFLFLISAILAFFLGRKGLVYYRESKLPGKERVKLEYGRLTEWLKERDEGFLSLTTPKEELDWMEAHYGVTMPETLREEFYATFFAPEKERDYESLREQVIRIRREVKKNRGKERQARS